MIKMNLEPENFLILLFLGSCISIFIEDLRWREFSIIWLVVLIITATINLYYDSPTIFLSIFLNLGYVLMAFGIAFLWFQLKGKSLHQVFQTKIGIGDLLISICLAPFFSSKEFLILFISSSTAGLLLLNFSFLKRSIPFAGLLCMASVFLMFIRLILFDHFSLIPN